GKLLEPLFRVRSRIRCSNCKIVNAVLPKADGIEGAAFSVGHHKRHPHLNIIIDLRLSFAYSCREFQEGSMLPLTKRQREILDYLNEFITQHGYAPSLEEIGRRFGLSSLATVHKHLTNLQEKGFIKRAWNRSRSVEMVATRTGGRAVELPMLGYVAAGSPIEAVASNETIAVP